MSTENGPGAPSLDVGSSASSTADQAWRRRAALLAGAVILIVATLPTFFDAYRAAAFQTSPRDDYAPALLALVGERGPAPLRQETALAGSPFGYRFLSVAAAIPVYLVLPYYAFSNLPDPDEPYLRATAALTFVSYVAVLLTALVIYLTARRRFGCSAVASFATAMMCYWTFAYLSVSGVDPLAVLMIAALMYVIDMSRPFAALVVLSAAVNEKVVIAFVLLFAGRIASHLVARRRKIPYRYRAQTLATVAAVGVYLAMRLVLALPGNEDQMNVGTWVTAAIETLRLSIGLQGLVQNGLPVLGMTILVVAAQVALRMRPDITSHSRWDAIVAIGLIGAGLAIGAQLTVGRAAVHSFPIYLPLIAVLVDGYMRRGDVLEPAAA